MKIQKVVPVGHKDQVTRIAPICAPLRGEVRVPGDKSISHRAVLFAAMAEGVSRLSGLLDSDDVRSSLAAVEALGAQVDVSVQEDGSLAGTVVGWGSKGPKQPEGPVYCGNSGTTVRLLMGLIAPWDIELELTGDESLSRRPMRRIADPLQLMGVRFAPEDKGTLPLVVKGAAELRAINFDSPVASAQLKTALLLAGVFADGETEVREPAPSRNHTELMLPEFGVKVDHGDCYARVSGPQKMIATDISVPGDPSSAAFLACAAVLAPGSAIELCEVGLAPTRIGFVRVLERMGAKLRCQLSSQEGKEPVGNITVEYSPALVACEVEASEIPSMVDEIPVLALVASRARGITVFHGVGELRVKESDRLAAIIKGLSDLGIRAWDQDDSLYVEGKPDYAVPAGLSFDPQGDHRLAMTWSLLSLIAESDVSICGYDCVAVSYPQFLNDVRKLAQ